MLRGCISPNKRQKKVLLVAASALFVVFLLSFLEPGYSELCSKNTETGAEHCASYNVVSYAFWRLVGFFNEHEPAFTALGTIVIGIFTWTLWRATERAGEHYRVTERAYVKMSHLEPGINWTTQNGGAFKLVLQIRNFGSTPANVTDVVANIFFPSSDVIVDLPANQRPSFAKETKAFLVTNDIFYQHQSLHVSDAERVVIDAGFQTMIIFGYADYVDQFGVRHRAGYGRRYLPGAENNLVYPDTGPFNYDRVRVRGEGIDWDEA